MRPAWYPDWTGETAIVVASGPSAVEADLAGAKGRARAVAINESWRLAPWADAIYSCDGDWWMHRQGVPEFTGLKITQDHSAADHLGLHRVVVEPLMRELCQEPGRLAGGGNSGFQTLNLLVQWGVTKIILVGFDMSIEAGVHWHGRHGGHLVNPDALATARWRRRLDEVAPQFAELGVEVVNTSGRSALQAYPKRSLEDALG